MDQKDSIVVVKAVASARLVLLVSLFALCFFCRCQALMPCIMAGMDQIDSYALFDSGSGMYKVGFTGDSAPRAVVLPCRQAQDAPHHGPYAPEGQLPEAFRKIGLSARRRWYFFYGPLCLAVTCRSCLPEEYKVASFLGDDSRNGFRIQQSSWFNSGYMCGVGLRGYLEKITRFLLESGPRIGSV